jgi:LPS-assembly lipoprotein
MLHAIKPISLLLCLLVAACGFSPMYGEYRSLDRNKIQPFYDQIFIENIPDASGQYLRNALIDKLYQNGRPADTRYNLVIQNISESILDLDITKNSDATRAQLRLTANMRLIDKKTGKEILSRKLTSVSSYNILQSQFTTRVSEQYTRENALDDIARQTEQQLALYFNRSSAY